MYISKMLLVIAQCFFFIFNQKNNVLYYDLCIHLSWLKIQKNIQKENLINNILSNEIRVYKVFLKIIFFFCRALNLEEDPQIMDNLGMLYFISGRYHEAKNMYQHLLLHYPERNETKLHYVSEIRILFVLVRIFFISFFFTIYDDVYIFKIRLIKT